jgi:hypothetical protein
MTSTAHRATRRRATGVVDSPVLDRAIDAAEARKAADIALLIEAIAWAETHPVPAEELDGYARWGSLHEEGVIPLAGEGAPLVAEFAPDELAAALGWSVIAARSWMGHGLELKWRLPALFDLTVRGVVALHLARYVADHTRDLPVEAAAYADRLVTRDPARLTRSRIRILIEEARLYHDPERAVEDERQALRARKVELWPGNTPATTDVVMTLDTLDAAAFDQTLNQTAAALKSLGDDDSLEVRRARAVGVLANPQRALDLLQHGTDPAATNSVPVVRCCGCTSTSPRCTRSTPSPPRSCPRSSAPCPLTCSRCGWPTPRSPSSRSATWRVPTRPMPTTHHRGWPTRSGSVTPHASSPAATDPPRPATWTTSPHTYPSTRADHRAKPSPTASAPSAADTTAPRPTHPGPTSVAATAATPGPHRPAAPTTPTHLREDPDHLPRAMHARGLDPRGVGT